MTPSSVRAVSAAFASVFVTWLGIGPAPALAQGAAGDEGFLSAPAPMAPPPVRQEDLIEPEVTIIETENEVIYEYRVNGQLYMARIQPAAGPPYYLMDINGDGILDVQNQRPPELAVPQWLLFSW